MGDEAIRLVNFVSEETLDESKRARGERVEDGTAQRDRPLYEILKENKDKKDAEFNERFKHLPPKALDEEETEFLENWEMSKREYERQVINEEATQLQSFQAAVAALAASVYEVKEANPVIEEKKTKPMKNTHSRSPNIIITVKPHAKKAKFESTVESSGLVSPSPKNVELVSKSAVTVNVDNRSTDGNPSLVSYSDESDPDE